MKQKIKLPKFNKGNSKLPKPGKLGRKALALAAAAVLLLGTVTVYGNLHAQMADMGTDPVNGTDYERQQVLVSGEGYKLDKEQKQQYALEKQKEKPKKEDDLEFGGGRRLSPFTGGFGAGTFSIYRPTMEVKNSQFTPFNPNRPKPEANDELEFNVVGKTYNKSAIDPKYYTVKYNKKTISPIKIEEIEEQVTSIATGTTKKETKTKTYYRAYYKITVVKGAKNLEITVKDPKKKETAKGTYVVNGSKERPSINEIAIKIDVDNVSSDTINESIKSKEGDTVLTLLEKIEKDYGCSVTVSSKKIQSIKGIKVHPMARQMYSELYGDKYVDPAKGSLKNDAIAKGSKWVIYANGEAVNVNTKLTPGMTITIVFELPEPDPIDPDDPDDPTDPTEPTDPSESTDGE